MARWITVYTSHIPSIPLVVSNMYLPGTSPPFGAATLLFAPCWWTVTELVACPDNVRQHSERKQCRHGNCSSGTVRQTTKHGCTRHTTTQWGAQNYSTRQKYSAPWSPSLVFSQYLLNKCKYQRQTFSTVSCINITRYVTVWKSRVL